MTPEPTKEQRESAKNLNNMIFAPSTEEPTIAKFLAARDAEIVRPWREAVSIAATWFESSRVRHHNSCPINPCDCGVDGVLRKFLILLSPAPKDAPGGSKPNMLLNDCGCGHPRHPAGECRNIDPGDYQTPMTRCLCEIEGGSK